MIRFAIALALFTLLNGCAEEDDPDAGVRVVVELSYSGEPCVIRRVKVRRVDVPSYLHDRLRIPVNADIRLKCGKTCRWMENGARLMGALRDAGYLRVMGEVLDPPVFDTGPDRAH